MVKLRSVEVVSASLRILRGITGIKNYVQRLSTAQRDRIGRVIQVVTCLIPQQPRILTDHLHGDPKRCEGLILRDVQVRNTQERPSACGNVDNCWQWL